MTGAVSLASSPSKLSIPDVHQRLKNLRREVRGEDIQTSHGKPDNLCWSLCWAEVLKKETAWIPQTPEGNTPGLLRDADGRTRPHPLPRLSCCYFRGGSDMCYRSFHFPEFLSPDVRSGVVMWGRPGPISCQETKEDTLNHVSTVAPETRLSDVSQEDPQTSPTSSNQGQKPGRNRKITQMDAGMKV